MGEVKMIGALVGDIVGSVYEFHNTKSMGFELFTPWSRFTDDSVMTLAVAKWLIEDDEHTKHHLIECMQKLGRRYPRAGYGSGFKRWLSEDFPMPYKSWGNGSGMRVSPVGLYAQSLEEALSLADITASVSHNHPEGVKGAQAIAACMFLCRQGKTKAEIKEYVENTFGYDLNRTIDEIRPTYRFDVSCQGSVPEAIIAFLEGNSFEEVIRLAISLGGDSDTIGCMAGAIAACMFPIPDEMAERCFNVLTDDLREINNDFFNLVDKINKKDEGTTDIKEEPVFEVVRLSQKNYKEYTNQDVVAFSFAHGGAMGAPGQIIVVNKDAKVFVMNYAYGDMEIEMCDEVCPPLKDCIFGFFDVEETPIGWNGVKLGAGNFLVLAEPLYHQLKQQMFKFAPHELYGEWIDMVFNCIKES